MNYFLQYYNNNIIFIEYKISLKQLKCVKFKDHQEIILSYIWDTNCHLSYYSLRKYIIKIVFYSNVLWQNIKHIS